MAASAVSEAINNNNSSNSAKKEPMPRPRRREREKKERVEVKDEEGEPERESPHVEDDEGEREAIHESDEKEKEKEHEGKGKENGEAYDNKTKKKNNNNNNNNEEDGQTSDKPYEMEIEDSATPREETGRRSQSERARQLAEEEENASKRRQAEEQEVWTFEHDSIPSLTLSSVPVASTAGATTPPRSLMTSKLRPRQKRLQVATSPPYSPPDPSPSLPFSPPSEADSPGPDHEDEPPSPPSPDLQIPPKDRRCWFPNCFKADRTIRTLRPAQINTCKSHLQKQESLLRTAITNNKIALIEGDGKDQVCAICIDYYTTPDHWVCANDSCSFIFCKKCVDFVTRRRSTPKKEKWICWVCEAAATRGKPKERSHFMKLITQQQPTTTKVSERAGRVLRRSSSFGSAPPSPSTPSKRTVSPSRATSSALLDSDLRLSGSQPPSPALSTPGSAPPTPVHLTTGSISPSSLQLPTSETSRHNKLFVNKKKKRPHIAVTLPSAETPQADTSSSSTSPPTPSSPPLSNCEVPFGATTQSAVVQYLMSTMLASLRHVSQDCEHEDRQRINSLFECICQLKSCKEDLPDSDSSTLWDHLRDISNLLSTELEASLSLQTMTDSAGNGVDTDEELISNPELDAEISRIQDFKEIGDQFRFKYKVSWRLKEVAEQVGVLEEAKQKDLDNVLNRKTLMQELTAKEIASLEEELNANTREEENIKAKEKSLVEQLRQVRIQLTRNETTRKALHKWLMEMRQKHDGS